MATSLTSPRGSIGGGGRRAPPPAPEVPEATLRHQDTQRNQLMDAILRDDVERIDSLVKSGAPMYPHYHHPEFYLRSAEPHIRESALVNPVDWACLELRFRAAMQLLELADGMRCLAEARPRPKVLPDIDVAGQTKVALAKAAHHGHLGLLKMLLERGAPVSQKTAEGYSALYMAVHGGKADAVTFLLQYKAWDAEHQKEQVLELAEKRSLALIFAEAVSGKGQFLPESTMSPRAEDATLKSVATKTGLTPLQRAETPSTQACTSAPISPLATPSAGARRSDYLVNGLSNAITQEHVLRPPGPKPDGFTSWGWSPLQSLPHSPMAAASGGAVSLTRPVLSDVARHELRSTDVRLRGELHSAIRKGSIDKLRGLVDRGAPLEAACDLGYGVQGNCIDWACTCNHPEVALVLLELADQQGLGPILAMEAQAAFFWSVSQGHTEVLTQLLQRGADVSQKSPVRTTDEPETALYVAAVGSRKEEMLVLLRHGAWERETETARQKMLELATRRKFVAEAFHEVGIGDFAEYLAPLVLPHREHGVWSPDYPKAQPTHWETPFHGTEDGGS